MFVSALLFNTIQRRVIYTTTGTTEKDITYILMYLMQSYKL